MTENLPAAAIGAALPEHIRGALSALSRHRVANPVPVQGAFMSFNGNTGRYVYGKEKTELPEGTELVCDVETWRHGWIAWPTAEMKKAGQTNGGKPIFEETLPITQEATPRGQLPPLPVGVVAKPVLGAQFVSREGAVFTFGAESGVATEGANALITEILNHFGSGMADMEGAYPRVKLASKFGFKQKIHGNTIYKPVFEIVGWEWSIPGR